MSTDPAPGSGKNALLTVLNILLVIAVAVLCYLVTVWVLAELGIFIPPTILKVIVIIIALVIVIGILSGKFRWW